MDHFHLSLSTTYVTAILVVVIAFFMQVLKRKRANKVKNNLAPQAKGAWPIIGHLHHLGGSRLAHKVLGDMADEYGPIFTIKLGVKQVLVVSNGEVAKECFTTNDKVMSGRPKAKASKIMGYNYAVFGLSPYGDYWRKVRKIIMLEILSQKRIAMLAPLRVSEVRASMKDVYDAWWMNKQKNGSDMVKVDMSKWFGNFVLNVAVRVISGRRFQLNDEEGVRFQNVVNKVFKILGSFVVSDFIPFMDCFDMGGYDKEMRIAAKEMDDIIEEWLKKRKIERQQQEGDQYFMDVLITVLQDASKEDFFGYDHNTIIKATCLAMLTASSDTTSASLTWALSLLLNNPRALKAVEDEIDEHVGRDRLVEESDIKKLVYLDAVIKESLRLHPAAPIPLPRESTEDCVVSGYNIPKGTRVMLNIWKIHHDPNVWSDPFEFNPERFLTTHKNVDTKGNHFELLPFGSGRRICPGVHFVSQLMPLTLANLIQQFEISKPSNEPIDMTETPGLTNKKSTPLTVLVAPRMSLNLYHVDA